LSVRALLPLLLLVACQPGDVERIAGSQGFSTIASSSESLNLSTPEVRAVAWGDVDQDGDLDLALAVNGQNRGYRNLGDGSFALVWTSTDLQDSHDVAWGDVNGDGFPELAFANPSGGISVHANVGGTVENTASMPSSSAVGSTDLAWGDVDGDGDLDLGVVFASGAVVFYETAAGVVTTAPLWTAPTTWTGTATWTWRWPTTTTSTCSSRTRAGCRPRTPAA
jgi:hypothetical protein